MDALDRLLCLRLSLDRARSLIIDVACIPTTPACPPATVRARSSSFASPTSWLTSSLFISSTITLRSTVPLVLLLYSTAQTAPALLHTPPTLFSRLFLSPSSQHASTPRQHSPSASSTAKTPNPFIHDTADSPSRPTRTDSDHFARTTRPRPRRTRLASERHLCAVLNPVIAPARESICHAFSGRVGRRLTAARPVCARFGCATSRGRRVVRAFACFDRAVSPTR